MVIELHPALMKAMWLLDETVLDPDSEEGRKLMMDALHEAEDECASPIAAMVEPPPSNSIEDALSDTKALGHSYHFGPPRLSCSVPWGLMLLRDAVPDHSMLSRAAAPVAALDSRGELTIQVDWDCLNEETLPGPVRLVVRQRGIVVACAKGTGPPVPLSITFSIGAATPGEIFVAQLSWLGGIRHLHCLAPLHTPVPLDGLLAPPGAVSGMPTRAALIAEDRLTTSLPLAYLPSRGLGIELELLTFAPEPTLTGCFTKEAEVHALLKSIALQELAEQGGSWWGQEAVRDKNGEPPPSTSPLTPSLCWLLARCKLWTHEVDDHVMFSSINIARRAVNEQDVKVVQEAGEDLVRLHAGGRGTMKSEFKSPSPTVGALNFSNHGAAEITCFLRVLCHLGAGAPALSASANGGCSLHVHVNVRNSNAGGDQFTCLEIMNVFFAWVRFDLVTARFARPWMWREPSMAPLYATGSEFVWREMAWEQGTVAATHCATYDVPIFVNAVRQLWESKGFGALSEDAKIEELFGRSPKSPASGIGRYCSLNLRRLTTFGTLEFRRFQGTLDDALIVRWAHFCVAFVECFRNSGYGERVLNAASIDDALNTIITQQEEATADTLMDEMQGFVDQRTATCFMGNSGAMQKSVETDSD